MRHQTISFIKSGLRIIGYLGIAAPWIPLTTAVALFPLYDPFVITCLAIGGVLVLSEVVGILEEIGHD